MTIRHMIFLRLDDAISRDDPRVVEAVAASTALRTTVPDAGDWRVGEDVSGRDAAADYAGAGDFASREALAAFLGHPEHQAAAARWSGLATLTVCDLDLA